MGGTAALNLLCGCWAVPRLCVTYPRLSPGGGQMAARLSSDWRRTVAGLPLHCAGCLWDTIGLPGGDHWYRSAAAPREAHGSPLAVLWQLLGSPMAPPWQPYGSHVAAPWQPRGSPMAAPWQHRGGRMAAPWRPHGSHVAAPRQPHGSPMAAGNRSETMVER